MPADVHQRMVGHDELAAQLFRFGDHILRHVQRHQHPLDLLIGAAFQMPHVVPIERKLLGGQLE